MKYDNEKIKEMYEIIDEKRQIELSDSLNELVKEQLIELLEKKGFDGVDNSLEISLFEYGIVFRETDNLTIRYQDNVYDYDIVTDMNILDMIKDMELGFFEWQGVIKESYLQFFYTENNKSVFIRDIFQYSDKLYEYFDLQNKENDIIRIITLLNNEE